MLQPEQYHAFFNHSISFEQYLQEFENSLSSSEPNPYAPYLPLNWQRTNRIIQHFEPDQATLEALAN
ncbi:MAG: hypothetical protein ACO3O0_10255, partial [Bacteroidia bacterium]